MARSPWWWTWVVISGLIGMVLVGRTIPARAQSVARMGFVWADNATAPTYTPNSEFSHNSADEAITITRSGMGRYKVRFIRLGGNGTRGGHVQVTAYGNSSDTCKVKSWDSSGRDFIVYVDCFSAQGSRIDTQYTVLVVWPEPLPRHTLTVMRAGPLGSVVTSSPAGIDCGQDCTEPYKPGTVVSLTAEATSAAIFFAGWRGDCSSNQNSVTITMNADKQCIARFLPLPDFPPRHTLTVMRTGPSGSVVTSNPAGIDCGQDCAQSYEPGTVVSLTAEAISAAIFFAGWRGDCSSDQSSVTITMNADKQCIARFAPIPN